MAGGATFAREMRLAFAPGTLWPEIARRTASFARAERDTLIAAGSFAPAYETLVNGVEGAAEESIRPGGAILYRAQGIGAAVRLALDVLMRRAPVLTGDYRGSFEVAFSRGGLDGRAIPAASFDADKVTADVTGAFIYSPRPFSRKVDVQMVGQRRLRFSVEPGLFEAAATAVRRAFPMLDAARIYTVQHPARERREDGRWIEYPAVEVRRRR